MRAEAISWSNLKSEVEHSLEFYKARQGDAVDLWNVFIRAWNNLKSRSGDVSLPRQSNYFCGSRLHHWNFVVGIVEIGSGSHDDKREAFRLAAASAAEFLLRLDDGQNEHRWRPSYSDSVSTESSDGCEFMFVRGAGSGPVNAVALLTLSDSSSSTSEDVVETVPLPSIETPQNEEEGNDIEVIESDTATGGDVFSGVSMSSNVVSTPLDEVPPSVGTNFLALCAAGAYDGTKFHRNMKGFMVQGGDPTGTGKGGQSIWGGTIDDEFHPQNRHNCRGIVSMANSGPNTNKQQFFITYAKQPHLNNVYTVFGKVIDGMDTLDAMEKTPVDAKNRPLKEIVIKSVTIHANPIADIRSKRIQPTFAHDTILNILVHLGHVHKLVAHALQSGALGLPELRGRERRGDVVLVDIIPESVGEGETHVPLLQPEALHHVVLGYHLLAQVHDGRHVELAQHRERLVDDLPVPHHEALGVPEREGQELARPPVEVGHGERRGQPGLAVLEAVDPGRLDGVHHGALEAPPGALSGVARSAAAQIKKGVVKALCSRLVNKHFDQHFFSCCCGH
ncbi:hypothetical protein ON010_g5213 [Phytophthora cinnamomi]|nr:hypothetical protein ON010_g5213 [Phytophthora cinnamomi]